MVSSCQPMRGFFSRFALMAPPFHRSAFRPRSSRRGRHLHSTATGVSTGAGLSSGLRVRALQSVTTSPPEPIMRQERTIQSRGVCRHRPRRDLPRPRRHHRFDGPAALPSPQKLVPQKHIGSAGGCTARGAERSADDRTHGTGAGRPFRASALDPRDRAGYRVSIAR